MLLFGLMILSLSFAVLLGCGYNGPVCATRVALTGSATSSSFASAPRATVNGSTIFQNTPISIVAAHGGTFEITYNWRAAPVTGQYSVFVDFIDSAGTVQFQDNAQPPISPSQWSGTLSYTHTVTVPASVASGTYKIVAGLQSS